MALKIQDFIDIEQFKMLQDRLNEIYSFPSSIIDNDGNILTATAWQDICTKFHRQNKECEKECIKSDRYIADHLHEANPAVSYRCPHGLIDNATPIIINGAHCGNYFTGQFFLEPPDLNYFRAQAKKYGFDEVAYLEAVRKVPIWTQEQLNNYLFFIKGLIEVISSIGVKNLEEVETQRRLHESEERYRSLLEQAGDGIFILDAAGKILSVNKAFASMHGLTVDEILRMGLSSLDVEGSGPVAERIERIINGETLTFEVEHYHKDGYTFPLSVTANLVSSGNEKLIIAVHRDLTERKRADDALRESEKKYHSLFQNASIGIFHSLPEGRFLRVNPALAKMLGYGSPEEMVSSITSIDTQIYVDSKKRSDLYAATLESDDWIYAENQYRRKDGTILTANLSVRTMINTDSTVAYIEGFVEDITEHKRVGEELKENESKLRAIFDSAMDAIGLSKKGTVVFVNPAYLQLFGYESNEAIVGTSLLNQIAPSHRQEMLHNIERRAAGDDHSHFYESRGIKTDGTEFDMEISVSTYELCGEIYSVGTIRDITERKSLEQLLRQERALYIDVVNNQLVGIYRIRVFPKEYWQTDAWSSSEHSPHRVELASDRFCEILGINRQTYEANPGIIIDLIHPEDKAEFVYKNEEANAEMIPFRWEGRLSVGGEIRWIHFESLPRRVASGETLWTGILYDVTERKNVEHDLKVSEINLRMILDSVNDAIFIYTKEGNIIDVNDKMLNMYRVSREEVSSMSIAEDLSTPENPLNELPGIWESVVKGEERFFEWVARRPHDDSTFNVEVFLRKINLNNEDFILATVRDITDHKQAEKEKEKLQDQLLQAQKMESVGRLAGGVAHDFNNMLGVIFGYVEMAMEEVDPLQPLHAHLQEIRKAAERSSDLTRQLLAFARKQVVSPKVLDLNETIEGMLKMLRRLIGEDIEMAWHPGAGLWPVKIDLSQINQLLANLSVNARDAIGGVGEVTIETGNVIVNESFCADHLGFTPGEYVLLSFSDDGCGMDEKTQSHLFEPFFTSKGVGKGTGLGLSMVYGIIKQNSGFIKVDSKPDQGTTFKIYLPRHIGKTRKKQEEGQQGEVRRGNETLLVVEDEKVLLDLCQSMLGKLGYQLLSASTPGEAIRVAQEHSGDIHLLMTDVIMPEMNGRDLAKALLPLYPNMKRLFMSGYTADVIAHHGVLDDHVNFIQKPFSIKNLATKVREVLDQK